MKLREDIVIGSVGKRELHADVYLPDPKAGLRTAIIHLHGGGWRIGSRKSLKSRSEALARRGFTVISAEYRLLPEAPWPASLEDVQNAIRWTKANADSLLAERDRVVIVGNSAGGHIGLCAAGMEVDADGAPAVAAAVAFYPPVWFVQADEPADDDSSVKRGRLADGTSPSWMLLGDGASTEEIASATPATFLSKQYPPTCVFHGLADRMVAAESSRRFHDALVAAGVEAELHLYSRQGHSFNSSGPYLELTADEVAIFFRKTVIEPETFTSRGEETPAPALLDHRR